MQYNSLLVSVKVDIREKRKSLDISILIHDIIGHVHIMLMNGLPLDTTKMNSLLLWVLLHKFNDGEAINCKQVLISTVPNHSSSGEDL